MVVLTIQMQSFTGAGATTLISASYLFGASDYKVAIDSLR